ncbi:hypothetical protein BKA62DRAFT_744470 [Auriculariales sp. MPI-PUGE-AT-0066]|nr:hypothetical protein BKA62DRAFT_744470 [Auriculariales sp. MPI-PUGE-AT-0066]
MRPDDLSRREQPYEPVFQPKGMYAYKIALPSRPQPGQTPWPKSIPPVVGPALGESTNRSRHTQKTSHARSSSMTVPSTQAAVSPPTVTVPVGPSQTWTYGLNPLLAPGGGLLWTLRLPTSYIKTRASSLSTPGPLCYKDRLLPVLADRTAITLLVSLPGGNVRIQAARVGELLESLFDHLRVAATPGQWGATDQRTSAAAYRTRCGNDANELAKGVKRIDLLGPNAAFAGIVPTATLGANGQREWVMRVVANV